MSYGQNTRAASSFSKPVETGKEYIVDITDTGKGGDGVTRIAGLVIFVKNAKAGDKNIKIKINSVGSRFATAEIVSGSSSSWSNCDSDSNLSLDYFQIWMGKKLNRSNRSKHDKFSDILRAIDIDGVTINEILFKTYISYDPLKKYLTFLIQQGLIAYRKEEKRFRVTQLGFHALDMYAKMDELLVRKTRHKRPEYFASFP